MESNIIFIYLILPLLGYLFGSIRQTRIINNKISFNIAITIIGLTLFSLLTKISFYYDFLDEWVICLGLFMIGYTGTRLNKSDSGLNKSIVSVFRMLLIFGYLLLPLVIGYFVITALGTDRIGYTAGINYQVDYRIKHIVKNRNFTYPGHHIAEVYRKVLIIEYPVKKFDLGTYGEFGFNEFQIVNEKQIPVNEFKYDDVSGNLILYKYWNGKYSESTRF